MCKFAFTILIHKILTFSVINCTIDAHCAFRMHLLQRRLKEMVKISRLCQPAINNWLCLPFGKSLKAQNMRENLSSDLVVLQRKENKATIPNATCQMCVTVFSAKIWLEFIAFIYPVHIWTVFNSTWTLQFIWKEANKKEVHFLS